jgi:hypothetical protein
MEPIVLAFPYRWQTGEDACGIGGMKSNMWAGHGALGLLALVDAETVPKSSPGEGADK